MEAEVNPNAGAGLYRHTKTLETQSDGEWLRLAILRTPNE